MKTRRRPWLRGVATLAVLGLVAAGMMMSPLTAAQKFATKKFVKKKIAALNAELTGKLTEVFETSAAGPIAVTGADTDATIKTLSLPKGGSYAIFAKLWFKVVMGSSTAVGSGVNCDLVAGSDVDSAEASGDVDLNYGTLSLAVVHTFPGPDTVTLRCRDEFGAADPAEVRDVRIVAVRVAGLTTSA